MGIGSVSPQSKLDVNGTIRPAPATLGSACSPLGAQAYNATTGAPLYCSNSGLWSAVGSNGDWPAGSYCILRAGGSCPAGFTASSGYLKAINMYAANSIYIVPANFGDSLISCHGACGAYGNWIGEIHITACCK